ncbi:MAG: TetR/AcrR family transcriptional regulator [Myxococcota bacterium]
MDSTDGKRGSRPAWAGNPPQAEAARQRLLEAAARCIAREGIAATTVAGIAAEAGVSRQTVYRYFEGRDQVALRAVLAAAEGIRVKVDRAIRALDDPADMVVETVMLGLAEARGDPVLRAIWDSSPVDGPVFVRITGRPGLTWLRKTIGPVIEATGWSEAEADEAVELILRLFLSLIISPLPERNPEEMRAFLYRHLVPGLGLASEEE